MQKGQQKKKSIVIFAIDIETRGQGPWQHGIISIGVCVGLVDEEKVLEKARFSMKPLQHQRMEERYKREFWDKFPQVLEKLENEAKSVEESMHAFRGLLDKYDAEYDEVYILCDNAGFDFGMVNFYLDFCNLPTLNYDWAAENYRVTHDADEYARGRLEYKADQQWVDNKSLRSSTAAFHIDLDAHDHMPDNDAEVIYKLHRHVMETGILVQASRYVGPQ